MDHASRVNAERVHALSAELALLREQQTEARLREIYIRMTPQEVKDFEARRHRISAINAILGTQAPKI